MTDDRTAERDRTAAPSAGTAHGRPVANRGGLALVAVAAVLGTLSFTVLPWFRGTVGILHGARSSVGDIGTLLDNLVTSRHVLGDRHAFRLGLSEYYYSWLAWLLLAAAVIVAVVATLPTQEGGQVRALGAGISVLGIVATLWAIDVYRADVDPARVGAITHGAKSGFVPRVPDGPGFGAFFSHLGPGGWFALAAFVLTGVAAAMGPRRPRTA